MTEPEDQDTLKEFVSELTSIQQELRSFIAYLMTGADGAPDVLQEVNLLLWEKRRQFKPGTNFRAWSFKVARYMVLGHQRKLRKQGLLLFEPDVIERLADEWQQSSTEYPNKLAALQTCFEKLPDEDQTLLRARYSGHGQLEQLASSSERSSSGLRARIFRLRQALKQCILNELKMEGGLS